MAYEFCEVRLHPDPLSISNHTQGQEAFSGLLAQQSNQHNQQDELDSEETWCIRAWKEPFLVFEYIWVAAQDAS